MADTQNPVYTDNVSIAGDGTEEHPLAIIAGGTAVVADGVTITGNGTVANPLAAESGLIFKTVKLTTAEVLTLNSAPTIIIPAPGAGKAINVIACAFLYDASVSFGVSGMTFIGLTYGANEGDEFFDITPTGFIDQASSQFIPFGQVVNGVEFLGGQVSYPLVDVENIDVVIDADANPTGGAGSTLTVYVLYQIVPAA